MQYQLTLEHILMKAYLWLKNRLADEAGQDLVEYALLVALVALALVAALPGVADAIGGVFDAIVADLATP